MDLHQLRTFVTVAREGSITRASSLLHLSQPAASAHIKEMEDTLGVSLFERTARGMALTSAGQRLLAKAQQTLVAHDELLAEAKRSKGELTGRLRIGAGSNSNNEAIGRLLTVLAERCPGVEVTLKHQTSREVVTGIRQGELDAGLYNEPDSPPPDLTAVEVSQFAIYLVAAPGLVPASRPLDWAAVAGVPWIYATESACCGHTAERIFSVHRFRPERIISTDRQEVTKTLVVSGIGVGLLHADAASAAERCGDLERLFEAERPVRVLFAHLASRAEEPLLATARSILQAGHGATVGQPAGPSHSP
jgi:molybdate transport repressor ModE-like protein